MTDHERCQNLITLIGIWSDRLNQARKTQWNFSIIIWTGVIALIGFIFPHRELLPRSVLLILGFPSMIMAVHVTILLMLQSMIITNAHKLEEYFEEVERLLKLNEGLPKASAEWSIIYYQGGLTAGIIFLGFGLLYFT